MKLEKSFLIHQGWADVPALDEVLKRGLEIMNTKNISDVFYIEKLLRREFDEELYTLTMGEEAPLELAIRAETEEEKKNFAKADQHIRSLLRSPVAIGGSLMPDACPVSNKVEALPVGGVLVTEGAIVPAAHSSDICCSMYASFYCSDRSLEEEMKSLKLATRFGPGGRSEPIPHPVLEENVWNNPFLKGLKNKAVSHMADQGDGNHFAFLGELEVEQALLDSLSDSGYTEIVTSLEPFVEKVVRVLVTHHGSRSLGATLYKRGLDAAVKHCRKIAKDIPEQSAWIDSASPEGQNYWDALQYVARWTRANHQSIHRRFLESNCAELLAEVGNEHNFVWLRDGKYYHGKGATPAWLDNAGNPLLGLIPLNMAEPILLVLGKNNEQFHSFAPHGAGRNLSRSALLKKVRRTTESPAQVIKRTTTGIAVEWYLGEADLSESPVAYKDAKTVIEQIAEFELADVIGLIKPRGSIMAGRAPKVDERPMTPKQKRQIQHRAERRSMNQRLNSDFDY